MQLFLILFYFQNYFGHTWLGRNKVSKPQEHITISINFPLLDTGLAGKALLHAAGWGGAEHCSRGLSSSSGTSGPPGRDVLSLWRWHEFRSMSLLRALRNFCLGFIGQIVIRTRPSSTSKRVLKKSVCSAHRMAMARIDAMGQKLQPSIQSTTEVTKDSSHFSEGRARVPT